TASTLEGNRVLRNRTGLPQGEPTGAPRVHFGSAQHSDLALRPVMCQSSSRKSDVLRACRRRVVLEVGCSNLEPASYAANLAFWRYQWRVQGASSPLVCWVYRSHWEARAPVQSKSRQSS